MGKNEKVYDNNNLIDYVNWRGDLSFEESPINKIDLAIFSELAMLDFNGILVNDDISIKEARKLYFDCESCKKDKLGLILPDSILLLFKKMALSRRYQNLLLSDYLEIVSEEEETQVSSLVIKISDEMRVVSFSGTDDSIIGWKEDFMMLYRSPIPSQEKSFNYLNRILDKYSDSKFYVCGHSKGGNMAIYSALNLDDLKYKKIIHIYNFDGPGFPKDFINDEKYISKLFKVSTILPQSSTIGKLFEHRETIEIVKSSKKGLYQHDIFSWELSRTDFVYEKALTDVSIKVDCKIKEVMDMLSIEEKEMFVESSYKVLSFTKAKDLRTLSERKRKIIEGFFKLNKIEKKAVFKPLKSLFSDKLVRKVFLDSFKEFLKINKIKVDLDIDEEIL